MIGRIVLAAWQTLACAFAAVAQSPIASFPPGTFANVAALAGSSAYQGPGDLQSGAKAWWGLRAFSLAKAGNAAINLCDNTGANCADIATNATTGKLNNPGTLGSNNCATSGTCLIKTFYDQTGVLACNAGTTACNLTQATVANMATLNYNCINGNPCAVFNGTSATYASGNIPTIAQTNGVSLLADQTGNTGATNVVISAGNLFEFRSGQLAGYYAGTGTVTATGATNSHFHALIFTGAGASSAIYVDGNATTGLNPGSTGFGNAAINLGSNVGSSYFAGNFAEAGVWPAAIASPSGLTSNQTSFWGPF